MLLSMISPLLIFILSGTIAIAKTICVWTCYEMALVVIVAEHGHSGPDVGNPWQIFVGIRDHQVAVRNGLGIDGHPPAGGRDSEEDGLAAAAALGQQHGLQFLAGLGIIDASCSFPVAVSGG
jgi:hypothetical protein